MTPPFLEFSLPTSPLFLLLFPRLPSSTLLCSLLLSWSRSFFSPHLSSPSQIFTPPPGPSSARLFPSSSLPLRVSSPSHSFLGLPPLPFPSLALLLHLPPSSLSPPLPLLFLLPFPPCSRPALSLPFPPPPSPVGSGAAGTSRKLQGAIGSRLRSVPPGGRPERRRRRAGLWVV